MSQVISGFGVIVLVMASVCGPAQAQERAPVGAVASVTAAAPPATLPATRPSFEKDVLAYETADLATPPKPGGVLFYGSSSIRLWKTLSTDFAGINVVNRGFGGSTAPDALKYLDRLVLPHKPATIVFYEGDNDLNRGRTPQELLADCKTFATRIHAVLPQTRILFLSIKPSVKRKSQFDRQTEANQLLSTWIAGAKDQRLAYVDIVTPMLDAAGNVRPELFSKDLLHMNADGYQVWTRCITAALKSSNPFPANASADSKSQTRQPPRPASVMP